MPFGEFIEQHRVAVTPLAIHRERLAGPPILGVVRAFSKRLVLIEGIGAAGRAGGFILIRRGDITRIDRGTESLRLRLKAAGPVAKSHPIAREIDLAEWRNALASAQRVSPALLLHREGTGEPLLFASRSIALTKHLVYGERPEPGPDDEGEVAVDLDHLTRLDFA